MKLKVNIKKIKIVNELDSYWTPEDYITLLGEFNFPDADKSIKDELLDLLLMAITDYEPNEAAHILLTYKLSDDLNSGQIHTISHEMQNDKVAEEYSEPALHCALFNINQLLYKAYNGTFPNTEASLIDIELTPLTKTDDEMTKEVLIKALGAGLKGNNLIKRLFEEQLNGNEEFTDAAKTIWEINKIDATNYRLTTSRYWIDKDDFIDFEYDTDIVFYEE